MSTPFSTAAKLTAWGPLTANTPVKVPAIGLSGRLIARISVDIGSGPGSPIYYGYDNGVNASTGKVIASGEESRILPTSQDIWIFSADGGQTGFVEEF